MINSFNENWTFKELLNVGEAIGNKNYRLVGVPDGLGVLKEDNLKLSIYMNHEIAHDKGLPRAHGAK
jgi:hypothetical protein